MPTFTYKEGIEGQTVDVETITLAENKLTHIFTVTAPDEESATAYNVLVEVALNDNSRLQSLLVKGIEVDNFHADTLDYTIYYPIGSNTADFATIDDIVAIAEDANAIVSVNPNGTDFFIQVVAADGVTTRVYTLKQVILLSDNNRLSAIYMDDIMLRDFDPEVLEYVYYVSDAQPNILAVAEDTLATIEYGIYTLDAPFYIYVIAEDGTERVYTIYIKQSTISTSQTPNEYDVLMKHVPGSNDIIFATTRKNITVAVYSSEGQMLFHSDVPASSQNDVVIITNAYGKEELIDVLSPLASFTLPTVNKCYFYVFFENGKRKVASGKLFFAR
jgi:hypothetical protein